MGERVCESVREKIVFENDHLSHDQIKIREESILRKKWSEQI